MSDNAVEREYGFAAAARILGMPESKLRYWSQSGFVGPSLRRAGKQVFSFQDLVSARAAKELVDRGFQPAQIRKALAEVRSKLPSVKRALEKLRVAWDGSTLGLVEDGVTFEVTGQRRFDFGLSDLADRAAEVLALSGAASEPAPAPVVRPSEPSVVADGAPGAAATPVSRPAATQGSYEWFANGLAKEAVAGEEAAAEDCYRKALQADPGLAAAHNNLGGLAYRQGNVGLAREEFEAALAVDPEQPEARYNLACILYYRGETEKAASELRRVVTHSPWFADAHYNLASALEKLGSKHQAALHLQRYIDLERESADSPWVAEARLRLSRLGHEAMV